MAAPAFFSPPPPPTPTPPLSAAHGGGAAGLSPRRPSRCSQRRGRRATRTARVLPELRDVGVSCAGRLGVASRVGAHPSPAPPAFGSEPIAFLRAALLLLGALWDPPAPVRSRTFLSALFFAVPNAKKPRCAPEAPRLLFFFPPPAFPVVKLKWKRFCRARCPQAEIGAGSIVLAARSVFPTRSGDGISVLTSSHLLGPGDSLV